MKSVKVTKAHAFEIDPAKNYLLVMIAPEEILQAELKSASEAIRAQFPNLRLVSLRSGSKFKVIEATDEDK